MKESLRNRILDCTPQIISYLFPNAKKTGNSVKCGSIDGEKGKSFTIALTGNAKGCYYDFATEDSGDLISLWANRHGLDVVNDYVEVQKGMCEHLGIDLNEYTDDKYKTTKQVKEKTPIKKGELKPIPKEEEEPKETIPADIDCPFHNKVWEYKTIDDKLYCSVKRINEYNGKKRFLPTKADGTFGIPDIRILYNLPEVAKADNVVFVEGEKCADAVIKAGLVGTCIFGGASSDLEKVDFDILYNKRVLIYPDNDDAGSKFATKLKEHLTKLDICRNITTLKIPKRTPEKYDAYDVVEDKKDLIKYINKAGIVEKQLVCEDVIDCLKRPRRALPFLTSNGLIEAGGITVLGGQQKIGKTYFLMNMLLTLAGGETFMNDCTPIDWKTQKQRPLKTFYFQSELSDISYDNRFHEIKKHLPEGLFKRMQHGNFTIVQKDPSFLMNIDGVKLIETAILDVYGREDKPDVIVIDPISNVFYGDKMGSNENDRQAMTSFLKRLDTMRMKVAPHSALVLLHHVKKIGKIELEENPSLALRGSSALSAFYTGGIIMSHHDQKGYVNMHFEYRDANIEPKVLDKRVVGEWIEVDPASVVSLGSDKLKKKQKETDNQIAFIKNTLIDKAIDGVLFEEDAFCKYLSGSNGFGTAKTVEGILAGLKVKGIIKKTKEPKKYTNKRVMHALVVEGMKKNGPNGFIDVVPTHEWSAGTGREEAIDGDVVWFEDTAKINDRSYDDYS